MQGFTIFQAKKRPRIALFAFAVFSMLLAGTAQFFRISDGASFSMADIFLYAPGICLIFAGVLRSYLFYSLSALFAIAHQILYIIYVSLQAGPANSTPPFDTVSEFALLCLTAALALQIFLFWGGRADMSALTNTTILTVIISLILTFLPYINRLLDGTFFFTDSYNVTCLAIAWLCFANGIEPIPPEESDPPTDPLDI